MGMDVYGKNPTNEVGAYFRRNVWGWHPLWEYCESLHAETVSSVVEGHSNSGDGLGAEGSAELAKLLRQDLLDGTAESFIVSRNRYLSELERPACELCSGTGIRSDEIGVENKMPEKELSPEMAMLTGRTHGWCNACSGEGKRDAWETNYFLELDDLKEFADFLENCGGFEIC